MGTGGIPVHNEKSAGMKKYLAAVAVPKARMERQKRGSALFVVVNDGADRQTVEKR